LKFEFEILSLLPILIVAGLCLIQVYVEN